jgi:hypothetical protein
MSVAVSVQPATPRLISQSEAVGVMAVTTTRHFLPTDVGDLMLWVRADSITGKANGETVGIWTDESGQGNDLYTPDSGRAPSYRTNEVNGLPGLDFYTYNQPMMLSLLSTIGKSPKMFMVVKTYNLPAYMTHVFITGANSATRTQRFGTEKTSDNYIGLENYFNGVIAVQAPFISNQYQIIRTYNGTFSGEVAKVSVNGSEVSGSSPYWQEMGQLALGTYAGGTYSHPFVISELIIYGSYSHYSGTPQNTDLSTADRDQVLAYLANKYAITLA